MRPVLVRARCSDRRCGWEGTVDLAATGKEVPFARANFCPQCESGMLEAVPAVAAPRPREPVTPADKLRELLATRPAMPNGEELLRWWNTSGELLPALLEEAGVNVDRIGIIMHTCVEAGGNPNDAPTVAVANLADALLEARAEIDRFKPAPQPTPIDEMAENLMVDLHALARDGVSTNGRRLETLIDKAHAIAVVVADTRQRLRALERRLPRRSAHVAPPATEVSHG